MGCVAAVLAKGQVQPWRCIFTGSILSNLSVPRPLSISQLPLGGGNHILTLAMILLIIGHAHAHCAEGTGHHLNCTDRKTVMAEQMVPKQSPQMLFEPLGEVHVFGSPPFDGQMEPQGGDNHHTCAGCSQGICSSFSPLYSGVF